AKRSARLAVEGIGFTFMLAEIVILENVSVSNVKKSHSDFMAAIDENAHNGSNLVIASGMSAYRKDKDFAFRTVFQRADKIMYARKESLKDYH
ncbi:MAG: hypothetical protein II467_01590, partial [Bacilli bacterium]|nr:hypothetical protein [Bacilli bacterium]